MNESKDSAETGTRAWKIVRGGSQRQSRLFANIEESLLMYSKITSYVSPRLSNWGACLVYLDRAVLLLGRIKKAIPHYSSIDELLS